MVQVESMTSGILVMKYYHDRGLLAMTRSNATSWHVFEAIGTTRQLTNVQSQVTDAYAYDAWGNELSTQGSTVNPHRYVGKYGYYLDTQSALMLLGVRYYDAEVGRFVSLDPILDTMNWYIYAADKPSTHQDATGLTVVRTVPGTYCDFWFAVDIFGHCGSYRCGWTVKEKFKDKFKVAEGCGIDSDSFCEILEPREGNCCKIAQQMGVPSDCLCAVAMAERSLRNLITDLQDLLCRLTGGWTIGKPGKDPTVGCVQLSVGTAREALGKLEKCYPELYQSINPPKSDYELRFKLATDCEFSMKILAAFALVNMDPKCTDKPTTCEHLALTIYNPPPGKEGHNPKLWERIKCLLKALKANNPCAQ